VVNFNSDPDTYTLSLIKGGDGDGQIKVNSSNHNLPYSETFDSGTSVSLEAVSSSGSSFTSWSNDLSGSTNPTSITMNSNKNVVVNFNSDPNTYTLSLTKGGDGDGQIKVNSSTHNLPYSETFDSGTSVSLEAVSSSGSSFTGWSGDLSGSTNPTSITMNEDKAIIVGLVTGIWSVDNEKFNIKIYPNPATNTINIVFEDKSYKDINVSLLNTQGQVVSVIEKDKLVSDNLQLDLSECSNGIYYLYIQTDKGAIIRKVSVMK
ncbi:MAG: T9SS type A sorting domain-containing protein, partial [Bacteroidales bacterium]|nr:T9SS type A sorting domain-containing protein [Bacteroidales bacterium]